MKSLVPVVTKPRPFSTKTIASVVPAGLTITEIVSVSLPDALYAEYATVFLNDEICPLDREWWSRIRPKPLTRVRIVVTPHGGGGYLRLAALIGLAVLTIVVAVATPYLLPAAVPAWAATAIGAAAAGAVAVGGQMLINKFLPAPIPELSSQQATESKVYVIEGARNRINAWGKLPFVAGRFRIVPPYAVEPYREIVSSKIFWRAVFAIGHGPLEISDFKIGETAIDNFTDVETEFRRGYWSLTQKGNWAASSGAFPTNPVFGDTWIVSAAGSAGGATYRTGETITFNGLAEYTSYSAWDRDQGKPLSLYPSDVHEEALSVEVKNRDGPVVRTSQDNADEIGIEVVFPRGLVHLEQTGAREMLSARIKIEQSPAGQDQWALVVQQKINGQQTTPLYWGYRWKTIDFGAQSESKRYDVRLTNTWGDQDENRNFGNWTWIALRTITVGSPLPTVHACLLAVRVKATGQLQGLLDEFNCIARSIARDWDQASQTWIWRPTSQPAALCRHILQHPGRRKPANDNRLDLDRLAYWDSITRPAKQEFNGVFDNKISLMDALTRICRIGMAAPDLRNLKFSPIIDEPKTTPISMFTPRNSWSYEGNLSHNPVPHAYRIGYANKDKQYQIDEAVVYDDGYSATNSTRIDKIEVVGLDNFDQAWKFGRKFLAEQRLRRETHTLYCDFEHQAIRRGDLVALQHDVISVGIGSARIRDVVLDDDELTVAAVVLDTPIAIATMDQLGMRVRRVVSGAQRTDLYAVAVPAVGDNATFQFTDAPVVANGPSVGDLAIVGYYGRENLRVIVRDIEPRPDLSAKLTLISEAAGVHGADTGEIPPYDPVVTRPVGLPAPVVLSMRSDATVMTVTAGRELITRVLFNLQPISFEGAELIILYHMSQTDGGWQQATIQEQTPGMAIIAGPESGQTYDFTLVYTHPRYFSSPITPINGYVVVGREGAPAGLQGLNISIAGGQALLRWDLPVDLDVQFGGTILFRHDPAFTGESWGTSTTIGRTINGDQTHAYLPLKPGTYLARVYDADGRESLDTASVTTKQASVLNFVPVSTIQEDPAFTGGMTGIEFDSGNSVIRLNSGSFASVPSVAELESWANAGQLVAAAGTYEFALGMDFGSVQRMRITSHIKSTAINIYDLIDSRGLIDDWPDFDGTLGAPVDASVWGKLTDDNPSGTPTWGPFMRIDSAEISARAVGELECRLTSWNASFNIEVSELRLRADQVA